MRAGRALRQSHSDASRQYGKTLSEIRTDHVRRYEFASRYCSGRVLDAACGCGYGSRIIRDIGKDVVGIDASDDAIRWAKENFSGPEFITGKIENAPWEGKFQTIVSLETLEHLGEHSLLESLKAFRETLNGMVIASVPNEVRYPFDASRFAHDEYPHIRHYTPDEFEQLLSGFFKVTGRFCQDRITGEIFPGVNGDFLIYIAE